MGIHIGSEEWQTTKRTGSLSAPLMLIWHRQENKGGKKKKNERNTYQHKDLSRTGLISSSSTTPNQFQSAPRCFLYIYIFRFPTIQICVGLCRASHPLHWHKHWSDRVLHSLFNGSLSWKSIQRIMISSSHWINRLRQEPIRKQKKIKDQQLCQAWYIVKRSLPQSLPFYIKPWSQYKCASRLFVSNLDSVRLPIMGAH